MKQIIYGTTNPAKMGDRIDAYWHYAYALAKPDGSCLALVEDTPRVFVSKPSSKVVEGYPLESLQIDPETGKYISEMSEAEIAGFWQKTMGAPLADFIQTYY